MKTQIEKTSIRLSEERHFEITVKKMDKMELSPQVSDERE
jgi:hypothetical protein